MYAICLRLIGDVDRATDAAQATFIRAWQRAGQFKAGSNYGAWIATIATTIALNELRANARRRFERLFDDNSREAATLPYVLPPALPEASSDLALELEQAIARLPRATRVVFALHDVEGYTTDEIAHTLDIAPATVRVHVHRARKLLRAHFAMTGT